MSKLQNQTEKPLVIQELILKKSNLTYLDPQGTKETQPPVTLEKEAVWLLEGIIHKWHRSCWKLWLQPPQIDYKTKEGVDLP